MACVSRFRSDAPPPQQCGHLAKHYRIGHLQRHALGSARLRRPRATRLLKLRPLRHSHETNTAGGPPYAFQSLDATTYSAGEPMKETASAITWSEVFP